MFSKNPIAYSFTLIPKYEEINNLIVKKNKDNKDLKILDLCCGTGYLLEYLDDKLNIKEYHGIDIDEDSIKIANNYFSKKNLKTKIFFFNQGDITKINNQKTNYYDLVFFLDGIEHINDDMASLNFANKSLVLEGSLILSTPHTKGIFVDNIDTFMHDHGPMSNEREGYSLKEIMLKLENSNFREIKFYFTNFFLTEIIIFISKLGYRIFKKNYKSQAELFDLKKNFLLYTYIIFVKLFKKIILLCDNFFKLFFNGHCLIAISKK